LEHYGEWARAKVNVNCHVEIDGHYYSVPHMPEVRLQAVPGRAGAEDPVPPPPPHDGLAPAHERRRLAAVQRIIRHQEPRITTEVYGHLSGHYLKKEMERLSFGAAPPEPGDPVAGTTGSGREQRILLAVGGAQEPPLPAAEQLERLYADLELSGERI
jgi:hypothetical protein